MRILFLLFITYTMSWSHISLTAAIGASGFGFGNNFSLNFKLDQDKSLGMMLSNYRIPDLF